MSQKQIEVSKYVEEENLDEFKKLLEKVMKTPPENRGPAAKAIMSSFQVYYDMIGGAAARAEKMTR